MSLVEKSSKISLNCKIIKGSTCSPPCHSPAPSQCDDGFTVCDMGTNGGCWMGNTCVPEGKGVMVIEK